MYYLPPSLPILMVWHDINMLHHLQGMYQMGKSVFGKVSNYGTMSPSCLVPCGGEKKGGWTHVMKSPTGKVEFWSWPRSLDFFFWSSMASSFCSDSSRLVEYTRRAGLGLGPEEACEVDVLDWPPGTCTYIRCMRRENFNCLFLGPLPSSINTAPSMTHYTVPELLRAQEPRLRVV